jgi:RNA polymerase sigma-70 factor (ECF subfamily)
MMMGGSLQTRREAEFRDLYDATRPQLIAYAFRRTHNSEDAADLVADVFAIAWRRFDLVPRDDRALLWLYATARRVLANGTRRSATRSKLIDRLQHEIECVGNPPSADDESITALAALRRLSDGDREILMLAGWEGLTAAEQACVLGCSVNAARIRLHGARVRLQEALTASEPEPTTDGFGDPAVPITANERT